MTHSWQRRRPAAHGVFVVRVRGVSERPWPGVASLGLRPTVDDSGRWLLEVHLLDFSGALYGRLVEVELLAKLRDESKYDSLAQLQAAIAADTAAAREWFAVRAR
jgi:riboflavin kinase / FMN adenylyltransferase